MHPSKYHQAIVDYYLHTRYSYQDAWDLNNSLAIHYGFWDKKVNSFPESLKRMNEVMAQTAEIKSSDKVLDAGCGVGGSSIFLSSTFGCEVTGISLSEQQINEARKHSEKKGLDHLLRFEVMNYMATEFADSSFDVVWCCESSCYADDKQAFIKEVYRLLKPGGRLIVADGFVTQIENNQHPVIKNWLGGWMVNYLETPEKFQAFMRESGFVEINFKDISREVFRSSLRLYKVYFLASIYLFWRKINFSKPVPAIQRKNITACKCQYNGLKAGLWQYGLVLGKKNN